MEDVEAAGSRVTYTPAPSADTRLLDSRQSPESYETRTVETKNKFDQLDHIEE